MKTLFCLIALALIPAAEAKPTLPRKNRLEFRNAREENEVPFKAGHSLAGARLGVGGAYEGSLAFGLNYEYIYHREVGISGQLYHSSYSTELSAGPMKAEVSSKATTIVALANYHTTLIKVKNLDPYLSLGIAHSFVSSEAKVSAGSEFAGMPGMGDMPGMEVEGDATFLVASINGRYFFNEKLSAVGSISLGISTLTVGVDYLF